MPQYTESASGWSTVRLEEGYGSGNSVGELFAYTMSISFRVFDTKTNTIYKIQVFTSLWS